MIILLAIKYNSNKFMFLSGRGQNATARNVIDQK